MKNKEYNQIIERCNKAFLIINDNYPNISLINYDTDYLNGTLYIYFKTNNINLLKQNSNITLLLIYNYNYLLINGVACLLDEDDYCYNQNNIYKINIIKIEKL